MDSDYKTRADPLQKCAEAALDKGLKLFALQNGGQCFGGKTGELRYNIYGESDGCKGMFLVPLNCRGRVFPFLDRAYL